MNSTFKVVFNKARGALMVVNEVTSSVQVKGTKTVVAAAVTALMAGSAMAAVIPHGQTTGENTYTNEGTIKAGTSTGVVITGSNNNFINNGTIESTTDAVSIQGSSNSIIFSDKSVTKGNLSLSSGSNNNSLTFKEGAKFDGLISVDTKITGTKLEGVLNISEKNVNKYGGAVYFMDSVGSSIKLSNSNFVNNVAYSEDPNNYACGGAIYTYASSFEQTGGSYIGNKVITKNLTLYIDTNAVKAGAAGGALMIKGVSPTIFTDVEFSNNSAVAIKGTAEYGGTAYGGAILADYSTASNGGNPGSADVIFKISTNKSMTYSGNTVSSDSTGKTFDTWGYHVPTAAAGGFLFLDRGASAAFNIESGATLTIGSEVTTDDTDSIASSIPNTNTATNNGVHALIKKEGEGSLIINSSLDKYYGTVLVNGGRMAVNSAWNIKNEVTVKKDGTLALASYDIIGANNSGNQDNKGTAIGGSLTVEGTLETSSGQIFKTALDSEAKTTTPEALLAKAAQITFTEGSTLALNDALFNLTYAENAGKLIKNGRVVMLGKLVNPDSLDGSRLGDLDQVGEGVDLPTVTVKEDKNVQIGGNAASGVAYRADSLSVGAIDLGAATTVTIDGGKTLTLAGNGDNLVKTTDEAGSKVDVKNGTLELGGSVANGGFVTAVELGTSGNLDVTQGEFAVERVTTVAGANVEVINNAALKVGELSGAGSVNIGNSTSAGKLEVKKLSLSGLVFLDPVWTDGSTVAGASSLAVTDLTTPVAAQLLVGQNSILSLGAATATANQAFESIANFNPVAWSSQSITAAAYVDAPVNLAATGGILVDGSVTASTTPLPTVAAGTVTVNKDGMLIVNQQNAGEGSFFTVAGTDTATVAFADGSYLGVVNTTEGSFKLAKTVTGTANVVTDNQFFNASVKDEVLTTTVDAKKLAGAVASMGVQQMARRADTVFAHTIADRTAQSIAGEGVALWVDVGGERYEADDLDNGAQYKANMFYGAFGADVGVTPDARIGAAIQYGTGDSKSDNYGLKNDIDAVTFGLYGSYNVTDAAKIVGEFGWTHTTNDVTSSERLLTNDFDADILSLGVRGQHEFQVGAVKIVPSVGVRVSRISTDSFNVGNVKVDVDDQTIVQVPLSVAFAANDIDGNGWKLNPYAKVSFTPTFGDDEINVRGYDQSALDTLPVQGNFGLSATNGNVTFGAALSAGFGQDGAKNFGGKVGVKYVF